MTQRPAAFAASGGLDLVTAALAMPPGRLIACSNYEAVSNGYARLAGHERYDGRPAPSAATVTAIDYVDGAVPIAADAIVTGAISGATARVLTAAAVARGSWNGGDAAGTLFLLPLAGVLVPGEAMTVAGATVATVDSPPAIATREDGDEEDTGFRRAMIAAQEIRRTAIQPVPGSGPVRAIAELDGAIHAIRDNAGATAAAIYRASAGGWVPVALGRTIDFTAGLAEIADGATIAGATSGATAIARRVVKQRGSWGSDAAGYIVLSGQSGSFVAETIRVGGTAVAIVAGNSAAVTLPPGGRYQIRTHNFYGASDLRRIYAVGGTGRAFEYDGEVLVPIRTGMADDRPNRMGIFRQHLFLAFPGGSIQCSAPGEPLIWDPVLGADEIGLGDDVTDMLDATSTALAIFARGKVAILTGTDADSFTLDEISDDAGAIAGTAQNAGRPVYLDQSGLRTLDATQAFGNFSTGVLTASVQPFLDALQASAPAASIVCKAKSQYRLYWPNGAGIHVYMGASSPETTIVNLGFGVACGLRCDVAMDGGSGGGGGGTGEMMLIGGTDGLVRRIDSGTSFDGAPIEAYLQFPYNSFGNPAVEKRFHGLQIGVTSERPSAIGAVIDFGGTTEAPATSEAALTALPGAALWNAADWDGFFWSAPAEGIVRAPADGIGTSASLVIASGGDALTPPHIVQTYGVNYSPRKVVRV
jgi:hypothetical protein